MTDETKNLPKPEPLTGFKDLLAALNNDRREREQQLRVLLTEIQEIRRTLASFRRMPGKRRRLGKLQ